MPRKELIKAFEKKEGVQTDFIKREKFWGGDPHNTKLVEEYNQNLERNQYNVCNRGGGNFSMRLLCPFRSSSYLASPFL